MAFLTMTYTFSNGTTASASEVNANLQKVVDANSDGTISYNIAALTAAGTATLNGAVVLGASSSVDMTFNAALASSIPIKTTNTYDIGSATKGLAGVYLSVGTTYTARIVGASGAAASFTYTLPNGGGTNGHVMATNGSGTLSYVPLQTTSYASASESYTILTTDGYRHILVTTSNTARTVTLPAVASSTYRTITIKKVDSGTGTVTIDTPSTETIDGNAQLVLYFQYDYATLVADGTNWHIVDHHYSLAKVSAASGGGQAVAAGGAGEELDSQSSWSDSGSADKFDTRSEFDATTGRFTAKMPGYYQVSLNCLLAGMVDQKGAELYITKNGTIIHRTYDWASGTVGLGLGVNGLIYLNGSTDYISGWIYNGDTVSRNTSVATLTISQIRV